jgi:TonB family protein
MNAGLSLQNFLAWMLQVLVFASVAAALPLALRIRHPRTQLAYCHLALVVCLALPWLQRWRHPVIVVERGGPPLSHAAPVPPRDPRPSPAPIPWQRIAVWTLAAGAAGRLCWILAGLWQIRRYRIDSTPLYPAPASVAAARAITRCDAAICVSPGSVGPVTFGFLRPVILLPESFLELDEEAQCSILCHELLHVRRHDWLVTLFEESAAVLFWFHPAIWWLLAQTRLAREQLVDSEVVRLTAGCEAYVNALLAMAGARPQLDLAPAPLFLRRRHLTQRVHSLLKEVTMSKVRLLTSYAFITAILVLAAGTAFLSFPLVGQPQVKEAATTDGPGVRVDPGAAILDRPPIVYPRAAAQSHVQGSVILALAVAANGEVSDARVVSGPQELRQAALASALSWRYAGGAPSAMRATIDFGFSPAELAQEAELHDLVCHDTKAEGVLKSIDIAKLPAALQGPVWQKAQTFQGQPFSNALMCQIREAVGSVDSGIGFGWMKKKDDPDTYLTISLGSGAPEPRPGEKMTYRFPNPNGVPRVFGILDSKIIRKVDPVYPPEVKAAGVTGTVKMVLLVGTDGHVQQVHVDSGPEPLVPAAVDAVKQWIYTPVAISGRALEAETPAQVTFGRQ